VDRVPVVEVRILDERIRSWGLPQPQSAMAAGVDLHACLDETLVLAPQAAAVLVPAGIAIHIADPHFMAIIVPRSGLGHRDGLVMGNLVGVIDADYTGPITISVWNRSAPGSPPILIEPGNRIAQLIFVPIARPRFEIVEAFSEPSERGAGGFGSTGAGALAQTHGVEPQLHTA
jgi:dUTP pyrophosphatase